MSDRQNNRQIALGTAQFGLNYGITNQVGRVPDEAAAQLLRECGERGWTLLDTAGGYGNSEERLGALLRDAAPRPWRVMTKTPAARNGRFGPSDLVAFQSAWRASQSRLGVAASSMHALLVHHADDLLVPGGEILHDWLIGLRQNGEIAHCGVSVYDATQLDALFSRYGRHERPFDIVQFPASIADQRMLGDPILPRLHAMGVQLHARSLYLQGLLLATPEFVEQKFPGKGDWVRRLQAWSRDRSMNPVQACISFFRSNRLLDVAVVGITNVHELRQLADAWDLAADIDWQAWASNDPAWVDPRRWGKP